MTHDLEKPINEPNLAASCILMYMEEIMREQDKEQQKQTILSLTGFLLNELLDSGYSIENAFDKIIENQNSVREYLNELKNEEE